MTWHPDTPMAYRNQIVTGDARELAQRIPDESVDLIFTDPVYQNIDDYQWLAETAVRILKSDGTLLTYHGIGFLPDTLGALQAGGMHFAWQFVSYMPTLNARGAYMTFSNWRSLLCFTKTTYRPQHHIRDLIVERYAPSDTGHRWAKNLQAVTYYLEAFCPASGVLFDPFAGGGTIPTAAKTLRRNYIAFEIDPDTAQRARERVYNTLRPLFTEDHTVQLTLEEPQ